MTAERFDELLAALLDGTLSAVDAEELFQAAVDQPEQGRRLVELLRLEPALSERVLTGDEAGGFVRRVQQTLILEADSSTFTTAVLEKLQRRDHEAGGSRRSVKRWLLAAAASLLIGLGLAWFWPRTEPTPAPTSISHIESIAGDVQILVEGKSASAENKQPLLIGHQLRTIGDDSSATVCFPNGTRLELAANTMIRLEDAADPTTSQRVFVAEGNLVADIAKQEPGFSMVIATPQAEVLVKGTRFSLASDSEWMHIALHSGVVEIKRKSDGKSIELQTGQQAVVGTSDEPFVPLPQAPRLDVPLASFTLNRSPVHALAFAPDVNLLALAQQDGPVTVRDLETNAVRNSFAEDSSRCNFLAFSPDGSLLAMRCFSKQGQRPESATLQVHELATGKLQASLPGAQSTLLPMLFSANSKMLAAVDENRDLQIWDIAGQKALENVRMRKGRVVGLWFSRDGQELRSANENGLVISWRLPGLKPMAHRQFTNYQGENECAAFSPDGKLFATGARGGSIQLWNTATGKLRATLHGHRGRVQSLAFAPDGTRLASGSRDETARLWDVASAKELATLQIQSHAKAVCFARGGNTLAIGGGDGSVKLWKVDQTP